MKLILLAAVLVALLSGACSTTPVPAPPAAQQSAAPSLAPELPAKQKDPLATKVAEWELGFWGGAEYSFSREGEEGAAFTLSVTGCCGAFTCTAKNATGDDVPWQNYSGVFAQLRNHAGFEQFHCSN
ncbi:MAG: hypothetical protein KBD66_01765 [Candidatus Doudnabacteria bacterium]|nr:hypothetical protein [Candidatus Doudnabacteria bacterium]